MKIGNGDKGVRDILALIGILLVFPGIWVAQGLALLNIPEIVLGATITISVLVWNFYFRKNNIS